MRGHGVGFRQILDGTRLAAGGLKDFATGLVSPTLRLGVTGLSRAGKTVFITALVRALLEGGRLPMLEALAQGRIRRVFLAPQPDDTIPRFAYEENLAALTAKNRHWPEGTRRISQLRLTIEYEPTSFLARNLSGGTLHLDISWIIPVNGCSICRSCTRPMRNGPPLRWPPAGRAHVWPRQAIGISSSPPCGRKPLQMSCRRSKRRKIHRLSRQLPRG